MTAYAWDMAEDGFPYALLLAEMRARGIDVPAPPSPDASRAPVMFELWTGAGLASVETMAIRVERSFADFNEYWATVLGGPSVGRQLAALEPAVRDDLQASLRDRLRPDRNGRVTCVARANAVKGRVQGIR